MNPALWLRRFDAFLAVATFALSAAGVLLIYAAIHSVAAPHSVRAALGNLWRLQALYVITGAALMVLFSFIDYRFITRFYLYIYGVILLLLLLVLAVGGDDGTNVARWLRIPVPFIGTLSMQPSEFSKIFMILFLAKLLAIHKEKFNKPLYLFMVVVTILLPFLLVAMQPSLSAAIVILSISLIVLFVGGLHSKAILVGGIILVPAAVLTWIDMQRAEPLFLTRILGGFQWRRIETFVNPIPGSYAFLQTEGSLYAITSGGFTGLGFLNSPHIILGHNDFIFAVAASQFGFVGAMALLGAVAFLIVRCIIIAKNTACPEGRLIAAGVAGMLIIETFFHVGVVTNLIPNTGMPFPFLSYGGSMIWVHMIAIGIVLSVRTHGAPSKHVKDDAV